MSREAVGVVIDQLLSNQELRDEFVDDPLGVLTCLRICDGLDLTIDEIGALLRTDPVVWSTSGRIPGATLH